MKYWIVIVVGFLLFGFISWSIQDTMPQRFLLNMITMFLVGGGISYIVIVAEIKKRKRKKE